ncbi:hypothetical protein BC939DRAFT_172083 [Gamsiella multidivaricata]|uniref:uncharacterized protein n=1 Tax=Gamsiella multidivaricata TaxID=101098 RepID=UPI00221F94C7|nr:uncharacterized protein BC939DRAFT_172083 [Gamsiella multidivaricata]KAI7822847.1 hypothetical protein BC939DRAFT_172083 [Gamsiella multidivaricata]
MAMKATKERKYFFCLDKERERRRKGMKLMTLVILLLSYEQTAAVTSNTSPMPPTRRQRQRQILTAMSICGHLLVVCTALRRVFRPKGQATNTNTTIGTNDRLSTIEKGESTPQLS